MKVAVVHPWFLELGGAEKVADVLAEMYPNADFFAISADPAVLPKHVSERRIYTSWLNTPVRLSRFRRASFMPLFPWAIEGLDLSGYDLVLSTCPPLMGINASQEATHICYCHSPQRSWWHLYAERQMQMGRAERACFVACASWVRMWEFSAAQRIDKFVSNSKYIANRVSKCFRRDSTVIYPPVNTEMGYLAKRQDDYYLSVSRLDKDKGIELLIEASNRLRRRLVVVGTGRREKHLKAMAGSTIEFLGHVRDADLPRLYANCRGFLFAADEDFGIAPVEAQAFGRPVIAYGYGGSLETVRSNDPEGRSDTGVFFSEQTAESVIDGILRFESREGTFRPEEIQHHARQFDKSVFVTKMQRFVNEIVTERQG